MLYSRSGEFELLKLSLTTNTVNPVVLDLQKSYVDVLVYESIYENTMTGSVSIVDTDNNIQKYGLGYGELIELEWNTTGIDAGSVYVSGIVFDITGPAKVSDHSSGFTLHFASPEMFNSIKNRVFTGHKETCSSIVESLFTRMARKTIKQKKLVATGTRNIEHLVFNGQTVFKAIGMCSRRSVSNENLSGYMFYEDNQEFKFVPIEELYKQEPVTQFRYNNKATYEDVKNAHEESFNTFQQFEYEPANKHLTDISEGQLGSSWGYVSLQDKSMQIYQTSAKDKFDENNSLGKIPKLLSNNFNPDYSDKLTVKYSQEHLPNQTNIVDNRMKLIQSNSFAVNIGVFGNSLLKVGTTCKASIPSYSSEDFTLNETDVHSGKFLIAEIKHIITPKQYNQRIKLIKDSYEGAVS